MENIQKSNLLKEESENKKPQKADFINLKKNLDSSVGNRLAKEIKNKSAKKIADIERLRKEIRKIKETKPTEDEKESPQNEYLWPKFDIVTPLAEKESPQTELSTKKHKRNRIWVQKEPKKIEDREIFNIKEKKGVNESVTKTNDKIWEKKEKETTKLVKGLIKRIFNYDKKNKRIASRTEQLWPKFDLSASKKEKNNSIETVINTNNQPAKEEQSPFKPTEVDSFTENTNERNNSPEETTRSTPQREKVSHFVEKTNIGLWSKMSSGAKEIMSNAYESIYMTPGLNKVVGKMEIAYNQFWMDIKEGKAARLKDKMDYFGTQNNTLEKTKDEISKAAEMLKNMGMPGVAANLRAEKKIDTQISKNENKMDRLQGRIEKRENRIKLFANKRDAIADRLITHYEKKLSPIEGRLGVLEQRRNEVELFCISTEVKIAEQKARIKKIEGARSKIEENYLRAGYSNRQINKNAAIKELNDQISSLYSGVQLEQAKIAARRREINKKIAKINKKAEPYRNKKNKFIRVKNNKPIDFGLEERKYADEWKGTEEIEGHTRKPGNEMYEYQDDGIEPTINFENYENMERFDVLTERWNILVDENSDSIKDSQGHPRQTSEFLLIPPEEIMQATWVSPDNQMTKENFVKIVEQYYKVKKIDKGMYEKIISIFIETK